MLRRAPHRIRAGRWRGRRPTLDRLRLWAACARGPASEAGEGGAGGWAGAVKDEIPGEREENQASEGGEQRCAPALVGLNRYQALAAKQGLLALATADEGALESPHALHPFLHGLAKPLAYPLGIDRDGRLADG